MPHPGAFPGTRGKFLLSNLDAYTASVRDHCCGEHILDLQRRYFKRYPILLEHHIEPSEEQLAAVDDDVVDLELDISDLSEDEQTRVQQLFKFRKEQIKRFMAYNYAKNRDLPAKSSGCFDAYAALLSQLSGIDVTKKPRQPRAPDIFAKANFDTLIKPKVEAAFAKKPSTPRVTHQTQIISAEFKKLSKAEQDEFAKEAKVLGDAKKQEWQDARDAPISNDPEDRQLAIEAIARFVQPVLEGIFLRTGWPVSLFAGGPEPADGGRLNLVSAHAGTIGGDVKMNFASSEHVVIKTHIRPVFSRFLQKCFSPEDCRKVALAKPGVSIVDLECDSEHGMVVIDAMHAEDLVTDGADPAASMFPNTTSAPATSEPPLNSATEPGVVAGSIYTAPTSPPCESPLSPTASLRKLSPPPCHSPSPTMRSQSPPATLSQSPAPAAVPPQLPHSPLQPLRHRSSSRRSLTRLSPPQPSPTRSSPPPPAPTPTFPPMSKRTREDEAAGDASPKRPRMALTFASLEPAQRFGVVPPPDCPKWLRQGLNTINVSFLGPKWIKLVQAWYEWEEDGSFATKGSYPDIGHYRPESIFYWQKNARKATWRPATYEADYEKRFWLWWEQLQPAGRLVDSRDNSQTWDCPLKARGPNGMLQVVAALLFWAERVRSDDEPGAHEAWLNAVEEVSWVLGRIHREVSIEDAKAPDDEVAAFAAAALANAAGT